MKKLIILSTFFFSISVHALPDCPSDISVRWDNCFGTFTFDSGEKYVGEWKDDTFNGQGTYTWPNQGQYVGEYKDGSRHGQGTHTFPGGDQYVGEYKDGMWHGRGIYTFTDGRKDDGYFMKNEYIPDICEAMDLVKGTESFGSCVVKLIDIL